MPSGLLDEAKEGIHFPPSFVQDFHVDNSGKLERNIEFKNNPCFNRNANGTGMLLLDGLES